MAARIYRSEALRRLGGAIATRLYLFAFLALLAVAALATAAIYFSKTTEDAATRLYADGFVGVTNAAQLELLLEHHRRIVESMPAEVDRQRIHSDRQELEQVRSKLSNLIKQITSRENSSEPDLFATGIAASLPILFSDANQVALFAHEFAQDRATEYAASYSRTADAIHELVVGFRRLRMQEAEQAISVVQRTSSTLIWSVLLCVAIAGILIGPIGLTTMHDVLSRLRRVTQAMTQLASSDTGLDVPSRGDADEVGEMARAVEVFKGNAIQLMARETELKQLHRRVDIALNNMTHGLCMFDSEHKLIVCNKTYMQMYDLPDELSKPGTALREIDGYRTAVGNAPAEQSAAAMHPMLEASAFVQELTDGRVIAVSERPMPDGGWVAVHEDITERRRAEAKIAHLARHDVLTDLPNRVWFRDHLETTLAELQPGGGCAVHCLDLDHFKTVNDSLGHPIGDELLKVVAGRLVQTLGPSDFVARIGGDEFAIVQANVDGPECCSQLASRIVDSVSKPYDIEGKHIVIGTSIGIAVAPNDGMTSDQLLKNADMALYLAKGDGRGVHRFFEQEMDRRLQARHLLELDLRKAIVDGEFELYYQPIVTLTNEKVVGFEALVRWNHPKHGQIPPNKFIPLAEETGLILPLGEWILRTACSHAAQWPERVGVAVNLSAVQFRNRNLVQLTMNALAASGLPPYQLDLEITESVLLQDEANILAVLRQLRALGIRISLDDFGTGYSSLAYLRSFPFDKIKIDRSFVQDMLFRKDCQAIVRAVIGLAQSLGIATIIEGVETREQLDAAKSDGCTEGQGYLLGRAMPNAEVADFLARRSIVPRAA